MPGRVAVSDSTGLLSGVVGNPAVSFPLADNDLFTGDEGQGTYIDIDNTACLMSPSALTVKTMVRPTEVDRGVADNTFTRIFQRAANFMVTILNTDYRGDDIPSRSGKASIEVKYRVGSRHSCPVTPCSLETGTMIQTGNLLRAFYSARKRAGLNDVRFHDLRHTFATRLVQAGIELYVVKELLGHKSLKMTMRYAHHYPESLRHGVDILDRLKGAPAAICYNFTTVAEKRGYAECVTPFFKW